MLNFIYWKIFKKNVFIINIILMEIFNFIRNYLNFVFCLFFSCFSFLFTAYFLFFFNSISILDNKIKKDY
jgi:hypothetical protein